MDKNTDESDSDGEQLFHVTEEGKLRRNEEAEFFDNLTFDE